MKYITTSWDDGHPSDERLSDLLGKYSLKGTFYIPRSNPGHEVMKEKDIRALNRHFEIGGHTLKHINLRTASADTAAEEIQGSYNWLQAVTGSAPVSFCPPFGEYSAHSLDQIYRTGFRVVRTTRLLSTKLRPGLLHTTLQAYPHPGYTYMKHLLKRGRLASLNTWGRIHFSSDPLRLVDHYLEEIDHHGGCLHVWGHSWELDASEGWKTLEAIFQRISHLPGFSYVENRQLEKVTL